MKKNFLALLIPLIFINSVPVMGAETETLTIEKTYTTTNKEDKTDFEKEIIKDDKVYQLTDISYKTISQNPVYVDQPITRVIETEPLTGPNDTAPFEKDGIFFYFKKVLAQNTIDRPVKIIMDQVVYDHEIRPEDIDSMIIKEVKDQETDQDSVICFLDEIIKEDHWEEKTIDIVYYNYNSEIFKFQGQWITKNQNGPLLGYEEQLLKSVGLSKDNSELIGIQWEGDPYWSEEGEYCRNGTADIRKYTPKYIAKYKGEIKYPTQTVYSNEYEGIKKEDSGKKEYTILATAIYKQSTSMTTTIALILILAAVIIILCVFIFPHKKKKGEHYEQLY